MPVYFEIHSFSPPLLFFKAKQPCSPCVCVCVCAEMYISETSRHVFHSEKGSLHGGKWWGRQEKMASYMRVCVSAQQCVTKSRGGCRGNLRDVHGVWLWSAVLQSHTNTHPLRSYTCPGCIIENGRQRTHHTKQREWEGRKALYPSLSSKMRH